MENGAAKRQPPIRTVEPLPAPAAKVEQLRHSPVGPAGADAGTDPVEREWERTFDAAGDAIFLTDREFRIARANRAMSQLLGKPLDEIIGKTCSQAIHGTDQPLKVCPLAQAHHTKSHAQGEIHLRERDVWLDVSVDPVLDEKGEVAAVLHIIRDVTERKKMKQAMCESEEKYRDLFENAREAIVLTDLNGTITGVNRLVEGYGFQREQLVGKSLFGFVADDHRTRAMADFKVLLGGKPVKGEMEVLTPRGVVCVEYRDHPILRGGRIVGVQAILTDVTKRKRAEQLLRDERDRVRRYLDIAGVMLVVIDTEERVGLINKKGCEILGYTEDEVLGKNWFDNFLPPHTREHIRAVFAGLMAGRIHPNEYAENTVLTRTGQERLMAWHNTVLRDETGQILGTLSSGEDITERRRAEEAYRSLVDHSLQGLAIFQDRKVAFVNQAMAEITGYTIDELLAMSTEQVRDFVHPEDREIVWQNHRRRLAGEPAPEHYEMRGVRKNGLVCWLDIHASRIDYRGKPAIQAAYINITERKRAEGLLRLSEEKHRGLFENAVLGMYQTTPEGEILAANPALVGMLGYDTFEQLGSRNLEKEGFDPEHPRSRFKDRIEADGRIVGLESAWKRRDGSTLWVRESARAVRDETGKTLFYEGTVEDITERKHADQLMRTLATTAMELVELSPEADLFQFIGEKVLALIGVGIVSVNSIEGDTLTVRQIAGATTMAMNLAQRLLGRAVMGLPLQGLHEAARTALLTGKLTKIEGGLYELFFRTVPRPACWTLEKGLGILECHSIGLRRPGTLLGNVTILTQKGTELNAGVIEAFVNQASVALERKKVMEILLRSEERYRRLVTTATEGIFVLDRNHRFLFANDRMAAMLGYIPQEMLDKPAESVVFPPELADHARQVSDRRHGKKGTYERRLVRKDGEVIWGWVSVAPILDANGEFEGSLGMVTDITERKKAEQELRETMRLNQILLDAMPCVTLLLRAGTREIVASNEAARAVNAVAGTTCFGTWAHRSTPCPWCLAPEVWATGQARHLVVEYEGVVWDAHWLPVAGDLYMHYAFDITERKRTEEEVRQQLDELRRWHDVTIRREERIAELKREVNTLAARLGKPPPYQSEDEPRPGEGR